jgi:predicted regulator of Ras-like GTPase activity (Roadblock/LC7/MglB family)
VFYSHFSFSQKIDTIPVAPFNIVSSDSIQNEIVHPDTTRNDQVKASTGATIVIKSDSVVKTLDSNSVKYDTIRGKNGEITVVKIDTIHHVDSVALKDKDDDSDIKDKITYKAKDSIVYDIATKKMYLYNGAETHYQKIQLNADKVQFDWTTMIMTAEGVDSAGNMKGKPIFKDDGKEYRAGKMTYNFKNSRGKVFEVSTSEGDAYLHSEAVKRAEDQSWWGYKSKYTTCNLDHPHFYFKAKKIKLIPGKVIVTGPANLWIADVPTPIYIPFAIFPIKQGRRSGIIIPKYGSDATNGFFLRDGGYYWAANDYLGAKLTGTIYTNGSFDIKPSLQYKLNYLYSGSFAFAYVRTRPADPDLPGVSATNDFQVKWAFQLDPKAAPTNSFSASVNVSTANFNDANRVTDGNTLFSTSLNSNINYSKSFTSIPFLSLTISANHSQNLQNREIQITFPQVALTVSRVTPFKSKVSLSKPKWYENIGIAYSFKAQATINTIDSLKYINITPNLTYNERWYFQTENESWVTQDQVLTLPGGYSVINPGLGSYLKSDTNFGFKAARDFSANLTVGTKVTGIFKFKNSHLKTIRHIFTPQVSGNYHPDFSTPFWGYYDNVRKSVFTPQPQLYSHFDNVQGLGYGLPPTGRYAAVNWALGNTFDIKVFSKKDSVNHEKKIEGLLKVNISGGYNFAADSLRLQVFNITGTIKLLDNLSSSFGVLLDPYATGDYGRYNTFYWETNHELLRFTSANLSLNATIHGKPKAVVIAPLNKADRMVADYVSYNPDDYYDFDIPWSLGAAYSLNLNNVYQLDSHRDSLEFNQYITVSGDLNLTPKWKIAYQTGFDFAQKQLTLTHFKVVRNLHCWELSFDWTAWPLNHQQFVIELKVLNPTLQDLKLTRKKTVYSY